jgi:hypothetical protein
MGLAVLVGLQYIKVWDFGVTLYSMMPQVVGLQYMKVVDFGITLYNMMPQAGGLQYINAGRSPALLNHDHTKPRSGRNNNMLNTGKRIPYLLSGFYTYLQMCLFQHLRSYYARYGAYKLKVFVSRALPCFIIFCP